MVTHFSQLTMHFSFRLNNVLTFVIGYIILLIINKNGNNVARAEILYNSSHFENLGLVNRIPNPGKVHQVQPNSTREVRNIPTNLIAYYKPHSKNSESHLIMLEVIDSTYTLISGVIITLQAVILKSFGQPWISKSRVIKFWDGDITGSENSQHMTDWYTVSHVLHGFIFYEILYFFDPSSPIGPRLMIAVFIESAWEVFENLPFIIERYRRTALAQGYVGDSILNSVCDSFAMLTGFLIADKLPVFAVIAIAIGAELIMAFMVRDNLTLNIIQLVRPVEWISRWQTAKDTPKKNKK